MCFFGRSALDLGLLSPRVLLQDTCAEVFSSKLRSQKIIARDVGHAFCALNTFVLHQNNGVSNTFMLRHLSSFKRSGAKLVTPLE